MNDVYDLFANDFGIFLFNHFKVELYLYILLAASFLSILLILKYAKILNYWSFFSLLVLSCLVSIFVIDSYSRGFKLNQLSNFGSRIVSSIEAYSANNSRIPLRLDELYPQYLSKTALDSAQKMARYAFFSKYELNKPYEKSGVKHYQNDVYSLTIYEDFMGFYYLAYRDWKHTFEFTVE